VAAARGRAPAASALAAIDGGPQQRAGAASPYRGLSAFGEQDAPFFFGREAHRPGAGPDGAAVDGRGPAGGVGSGEVVAAAGRDPAADPGGRAGRRTGAGVVAVPGVHPHPRPLDELALQVAVPTGTDAAAVRRGLEAHPEGFALTAGRRRARERRIISGSDGAPAGAGYPCGGLERHRALPHRRPSDGTGGRRSAGAHRRRRGALRRRGDRGTAPVAPGGTYAQGRPRPGSSLFALRREGSRRGTHRLDLADIGLRLEASLLGESAGLLRGGPVVVVPTGRVHAVP
jgi:hypothetical protein